jgi:hypothetical protein
MRTPSKPAIYFMSLCHLHVGYVDGCSGLALLILGLVRRIRTAVLLGNLLFAAACYASQEMEFKCRHCHLKGTFLDDGLLTAAGFPAFCRKKDHFVSITWDYHKRPPKPVRFERGMPVHTCPICGTPTARKLDQTACPRCRSKDYKTRFTGMFVD